MVSKTALFLIWWYNVFIVYLRQRW